MTALRLDAVVRFAEAQVLLDSATTRRSDSDERYRRAYAAMRDAWQALTAEEQYAVNAAYEPGGVEVTPA